MKKFFKCLPLSCILLSSITLASQNGGFIYLAANAGIFQATFNNSYLDQTSIIPQNIVQPAEQHGYTGGLALGYRHLFNSPFFIGGELSGNMEGHSADFQSGAANTAFSDSTQINNHINLLLVPGILLDSKTGIYGKLGMSCAWLQDNLTSPTGYTPTIVTYNSNRKKLGFAAGLGFERQITEQITLFTEGNYHDYGTVTFPNFQNFTTNYRHTSHVYSYDVVAGVRVQFNV